METERLVESVSGIGEQVTKVENLTKQAQTSATNAALSEQAAKTAETNAQTAQAGAETAEGNAELAERNAKASEQAVEKAKQLVTQMGQEVLDNKNHVDQTAQAFTLTAQQAVADVNNAGQTQTERVQSAGNTAVESVKTAQTAATKAVEAAQTEAVNALQAEGATQTGNVSAEGAKQVQAVQQAAQEIMADREQIAQNKTGIEALKQGKADAIVETASGEIIQVEDSSGLGFEGLRIFGKSTQDGVPSPESPVPIVSAGDKGTVGVNVFEVNLINFPEGELINNGITYTSSKGAVEVKGKTGNSSSQTDTGALTCVLPKKLKGIFYLSGTSSNVLVNVKITLMDGKIKYFGKGKFILDGHEKEVKVYIRVDPNKTVNETIYPMINIGDVQLPWEPYRELQTLTIPTPNGLPGIKVDSGGNYTDMSGQQWVCDEIDHARGKYVQRIAENVWDTVSFADTGSGKFQNNTLGAYKLKGATFASMANFARYSAWANESGGFAAFDKYFYYHHGSEIKVEELNELFNSKAPIKIIGQLETPTERDLSSEEIQAYKALHTNYPTTVIMNDENAGMKVSYVADTKHYIEKKFKELNQAIVNTQISLL